MLPVFESNFESFRLRNAEQVEENSFNLGGRFVKMERQVSTARYEYFGNYDETIKHIEPFLKYNTFLGFKKGGFLLYGVPKSGKTALLMKMCAMDPKITVYSLRIAEFKKGDAEVFFEIAKNHGPAVIILEDLDEVIHPRGKARHLKQELFHEIFKVHYPSFYMPKRVIVAAESAFPFLLEDAQLKQIFQHSFFLPLVNVKMREEWPKPKEWRDRDYVSKLRTFRDNSELLIEERMKSELERSFLKKLLLRVLSGSG